MSSAKVTLLGLYRWQQSENLDLFEKLIIPDSIDRQALIDNILLESADFEVLYSNPLFMADAIELWSKKHKFTFDKWADALSIDYNPLYNYDMTEEFTDEAESRTGGHIENHVEDTGRDESRKSAFDSSSYQPYGLNESNNNTNSTSDSSGDESNNSKHYGRKFGNLGVTTSQQMLQSELDIARFNLIQQITNLFIDEFCIQIYI